VGLVFSDDDVTHEVDPKSQGKPNKRRREEGRGGGIGLEKEKNPRTKKRLLNIQQKTLEPDDSSKQGADALKSLTT